MTHAHLTSRSLIVLFLSLLALPVWAENYGSFIGRVVAEWGADGRTMTLMEPFAYIDPTNHRWEAPSGSKIDGASIPQIAWSLIGGPFEGKYRAASVIHDVACAEKTRYWRDVHRAFYTGMLASGVDVTKAKIMYAAVYHFGPRWEMPRISVFNQRTRNFKVITEDFEVDERDRVVTQWPSMNALLSPESREPESIIIFVEVNPEPPSLSTSDFEELKYLIRERGLSIDTIENFKLGQQLP